MRARAKIKAADYQRAFAELKVLADTNQHADVYNLMGFSSRKMGDDPQESTLRPGVRRLVVLRSRSAKVPFSPDGPLTWGEIDLIRTDVFNPVAKMELIELAFPPQTKYVIRPSVCSQSSGPVVS